METKTPGRPAAKAMTMTRTSWASRRLFGARRRGSRVRAISEDSLAHQDQGQDKGRKGPGVRGGGDHVHVRQGQDRLRRPLAAVAHDQAVNAILRADQLDVVVRERIAQVELPG